MPITPADIVNSRHPLYYQNAPKWQYFSDHYTGGIDYAAKVNPIFKPMVGLADPQRVGMNRYVSQHKLEGSSDYLVRLYKAVCVNICAPAVDLLAGTVGAPDTVTLTIPPDYQDLVDDCDLTGSTLSQFMLAARTNAAIYGHVFILCDSTRATGEIRTEADVQNQGIRPYFRQILPTDMLTWRLDTNGKPIEVLFRVQREAPGSILNGDGSKEQEFEYRYWSATEWIVFRQQADDFVVAEQGANQIGEVPVVALYHKQTAPFLGESLLAESAKYGQMLSNWISDLDATMETQSFAQPCLRSENKPSEVGVGASQILHLHTSKKTDTGEDVGEADFFFRSPDAAPLATMWDSFFRVLDMANASMALAPEATTDKAHPESGISRAWRWHSTEKRLVAMATNEQSAVAELFDLAADWKGQSEFTGSIVYGTNFDMSSLEQDINSMLSLQAVGLPNTAQNELKSRAVKKALPNLAADKQAEIDAEMKMQSTATRRGMQDMLNDQG